MRDAEFKKRAERDLFIIGEAGVNHDGDVSVAKELVDVAAAAKCDAVKFQTWITEHVYSPVHSKKPTYHARKSAAAESEYEVIKKLELSFEAFSEIKAYCDKRNIIFLSTADEKESLDFLLNLGMPFIKTASQDVTNLPFLRYVASRGKPVIFSTGGCSFRELIDGASVILERNDRLIVMHCVSSYPAPMRDLNLSFIRVLQELFSWPVGFSDHTLGIEAACAAVSLGARVVEKHFTMSRKRLGVDHQASLEPAELECFVKSLRCVRGALGDGKKRIMPSEKNISEAFRRYIVSARPIKAGRRFVEDDFWFKKITSGIEPKHLDAILGASAACSIKKDSPLNWAMVNVRVGKGRSGD